MAWQTLSASFLEGTCNSLLPSVTAFFHFTYRPPCHMPTFSLIPLPVPTARAPLPAIAWDDWQEDDIALRRAPVAAAWLHTFCL